MISTLQVKSYRFTEEFIHCDCGVQLSKLSSMCIERGYKGFSKLISIPGTIGAAIFGNSGHGESANKDTITSHLHSVSLLTASGDIVELSKKDLRLSRRSSALKRKEISGNIVRACFKIELGDANQEKEIAMNIKKNRKLYLESPYLNLGSVFVLGEPKDNLINRILSIFMKWAPLFIGRNRSAKLRKNILLSIFRCKSLSPYISDRVLNTFIWRDDKAPELFEFYKNFINRVYTNPTIEIDIKGTNANN